MRRLVLLLGLLAGCGAESPPKPAAAPSAALQSAAVEVRDVELTYSAEAVVEAVRQSTVSAQIAGRIVELRFDVGDYVKKGDVIVRIDERAAAQAVAASEAQVRQAQAALRNARAEYERSRQLVAQKFLSPAALDRAEAEYKAAQERVSALLAGAGQAATERGFATVVAPYSGIVSGDISATDTEGSVSLTNLLYNETTGILNSDLSVDGATGQSHRHASAVPSCLYEIRTGMTLSRSASVASARIGHQS